MIHRESNYRYILDTLNRIVFNVSLLPSNYLTKFVSCCVHFQSLPLRTEDFDATYQSRYDKISIYPVSEDSPYYLDDWYREIWFKYLDYETTKQVSVIITK